MFDPLRGSSYLPLPDEVKAKHAVVNIQNDDDKCFLWCMSAAVYGDPNGQNAERVAHYREHENKWNVEGIEMPMKCTERNLAKFERRNDVSVSVYAWEEGGSNENDEDDKPGFAYPLRVAREVKPRHANLLLIANDEKQHYCWIKNFSRLVGAQYTASKNEHAYCRFCLHGFYGVATAGQCTRLEDAKRRRDEHESECFVHGGQKTSFPSEPTLKFDSIEKQVEAPFVVYADFESLLEPMDTPSGKRTVKYEEHVACSYAYKIVSRVPGVEFEPRLHVGFDAAEHFLRSLQRDLYDEIMPLIDNDVDIIFDDDAKRSFDEATECFICSKPLDRENNIISKDHCHFTGRFRGAVHQSCNFRYKVEKDRYKLPVLFQNLRGYDAHLIMQAVRKRHGNIDVIPNNYERYQSFSIGRLKFLDSYQFLQASLDKLAKAMNKDNDFKQIAHHFPDPVKRELMLRKGAYPYDYMKKITQFDERQLPAQEDFYNRLNGASLSDADYEHAKNVWTTFECRKMQDYHDLYLLSDVLLLADIFEKFRCDSQALYGLEPVHYYSLPGLSWDAMMKHSGVELELIRDIDMYEMVEKGIRGGISMISRRYAKANDPRMGDAYDPSQPTTTLLYMDANSLYPGAMCEKLPVDQFEWEPQPELFDVTQVPDDGEIGYICEVDGYFPDTVHDALSDYPPAPEKMRVTPDMLSAFQQEHFPSSKGTEKLVPNLLAKEKYVVHHETLKCYIALGFVVTKVHRVIRFRQSAFLRSYMEMNIQKRREAAVIGDKARVGTTKLAMNAIFGKTMENVRTHVNIELLTIEKVAKKRIAKPNFKGSKRFHDHLVGVELTRSNVELNKPVVVGLAILDLSKRHMYREFYERWLLHFPKTKLLFTDTDSFCVEVEHPDVYAEMATFKDWFDFSEYPIDHPLYDETNRKVIGKFKDELHGACMTQFVGLRPKLYSFEYVDASGQVKGKNTAKGVKECVKDSTLHFADYERCLREMCVTTVSMNTIRSDKHKLYTYNVNKIGLSAYDDKRYICEDGVTTLAHGHWRTAR